MTRYAVKRRQSNGKSRLLHILENEEQAYQIEAIYNVGKQSDAYYVEEWKEKE